MSEFKNDLRRFIDGLEQPVSVHETMNRRQDRRRFSAPVAILAGAAIVLIPALVLIGIRFLPVEDGDVADTTAPQIAETTTTVDESTTPTTTAPPPAALVRVPDLRGLSEAVARDILAALGLELEVVDTYPAGETAGIMAQEPAPNEATAPGTVVKVDLAVVPRCESEGPDLVDPGEGQIVVTIWLQCGVSDYPAINSQIDRSMPQSADMITPTINALLSGPTEEERQDGYSSFFSAASGGGLDQATQRGDRLTVDFNEAILINNASTSTGSMFFMAELQANIFQFEEIESVEFQLNGSCDAFWNWLQRDCTVVGRGDWEKQLRDWAAANDSGKSPAAPTDMESYVGNTYTTEVRDGEPAVVASASGAATGLVDLGGWLLDDTATDPVEWLNWATHVGNEDTEMIWLVAAIERSSEDRMIYEVRAALELPRNEIQPELTGDPYLMSGQEECTIDDETDHRLVVLLETTTGVEVSAGFTSPLRAWIIDVEDAEFQVVDPDRVACWTDVP